MKKTLIAVAALAATSAFAQATVYGRLDLGYQNMTESATVGGVTAEAKNNGFRSAGSVSTLWGIKGSEDLGGGMSANFQLEGSVEPATGTAVGFTRVSTLGLSGGFGSVNIGRYYTPLFQMVGASDVFGTTGATTVNLYPDGVRSSNSVFYVTPAMGGLQVKASYGNNDNSATPSPAGDDKSSNMGFSVAYNAGPMMVGAAMGSNTATAGATESKDNGMALSASYDLGAAKIYFGYVKGKTQGDTAIDTYDESTEINLGVSAPLGGGLAVQAAFGTNKVESTNLGVTGDAATGTDFVLGLSKNLSKRTAVYVKTGVYNKLELAGDEIKTSRTNIGLRHVF